MEMTNRLKFNESGQFIIDYLDIDYDEDKDDENGMYYHTCPLCEKNFIGHKNRIVCKKCRKPTI
jgi:hypothetical protein